MKKRHVSIVEGGLVIFDYPGKSGNQRVQAVVDTPVGEVLLALKAPPRRARRATRLTRRPELAGRPRRRHHDYIKNGSGGDFIAKDFRTWHATVLAAIALAVAGRVARSPTARKRAITRSIAEVAHYLGNTPAVCRASYIDPRVRGFLLI